MTSLWRNSDRFVALPPSSELPLSIKREINNFGKQSLQRNKGLRGGVLFFIPVISYIIKMCYAQTSAINPLSPWRGVGGESLERHPKHKPYAMFMGSRKVIIVEAADILHMDDFEDVVEAED